LSKLLRKSDTVSRFGGDEFLILLNNLNSVDDIAMLTRKILSIFDKPFIIKGQEYFVTASAGVAVYPVDGEEADPLIKNADIAMYKAKERGKNQYLFCTADMKNEILMKMKLTNSLYRALERDEFVLHYQPQVCTKTKKVIAAEALIRWNHPDLGMIPPSVFIPLAEQTGLIGSIGEWVLRTACIQCKLWHTSGLLPIRIAVNVSVIQFRNPDLISQIERILKETQLEPQYLELEITESVAINESEYIIEVLNALKKLGISISIDDFGTEYSSLSRLTSMPIDRIKMDIQFIRSIHKSDKDKAIALGIIGLAHNLGLKVIAEGVETEMQMDFLSQKKCDEIQGFYFYRPVNAEDFEKILRK
jgi:EAL domain-containing protein (putative c-di-GMP-specific phosphodiesterase class I)